MTTLAITPNWKNKTAKFKGAVAAGEHVSVTIQNENGEGGEFIEDVSTLRLRVVNPCNGRTLAIFPEPVPEGETPEEWDSDLSPLRCTLNLNTVQMLKAVPPAANVPLLWVLDDYDNNTLYFKEQFPVEHWPRLRGEEEPTDLDNYKDIIEDFNTRLTTAEQTVETAATNAQSAANSASAAASSAATAATAATDAQAGAIASKNAAQTAANDAASAKTAAETAQGKAEEAQEAAETAQGKAQEYAEAAAESAAAFVVDDTFSVEGAAADAKAVGEANQDLITQINTVQDNLDAEVTARETLAAAVGDNRQNLAAEIARAQSAEQGLENRKADKTAVAAAIQAETSRAQTAEQGLRDDVSSAQTAIADRYTKTEVDAKIAGGQTFKKYLVQTLPDPDEADMKGLYLVPTGETTPEGDLCEEWTVVEENGVRRWERIGAKAVDLTLDDTVTRTSANGVKSSGIWSALWGALAALPAGFLSLYDWCVAQFAKYLPLSGGTMTGGLTVPNLTVGSRRDGSTVGSNSVAEGSNNTASGDRSHAEGASTTASGNYSHAEGGVTTAQNAYEHAQGCANASHKASYRFGDAGNTLSSIGFGSDINNRKNAVETMQDGKTYIYGLGGYDGTNPTSATDLASAVNAKADRAANPTAGNLAALDANGNPTDSTIPAANVALKSAIPYTIGTPIVIDAASSEVVEGETVNYGEATLADRTANIVQVTASTPLDELRITFPSATSGKVRDFGLRVEIGTGSAALAAPALVPIGSPGEAIKIENNAKEIPTLADGTATAKGVTLLYFSETAPGVFVVKGEQVEEVA